MLAGRAPVPGRCLPGRQPAIAGGSVPRNSECTSRACKLPQLCRLCWCTPERPPELHSAVLDDCPAPISAPVSSCATPAQMRARWRCLRTNPSALSCCAPATPSWRRPPALPRPAWRRSPANPVLKIWSAQIPPATCGCLLRRQRLLTPTRAFQLVSGQINERPVGTA